MIYAQKTDKTMPEILENPRYRGKHVILAAGKLYTAKTGDKASEILRTIREKHPGVTPQVAYLPRGKFLIV